MTWPDMEMLTSEGDVTQEEAFRFRSKGARKFYPHLAYYMAMKLYCGCDVPEGTVNGQAFTDEQCEDIKTCSKPKPGGGTENGSCFLGDSV